MKQSIKTGLLTAMVLGILGGCGGGGGTAVPTATVTGNAATGAAIAAGVVTLKCVSGTTTAATTGADGSFTIDISAVTLPCVGRVDYKDASGVVQKLHTFISTKGTANITPVTELLVANLTGGTALDAFDKFDAAKTKAFTAAQVTAAAAAVKTYLKNTLGVDTTSLPDDPVGTKFIPQSGATAGDAFDKVLDAIQAKLKAGGKKLSDITVEVSVGGGTGGGNSANGPTVDKAKLALLCPTSPSTIAFTNCKATQNASTNGLMVDINAWLVANAKNLKVTQADAGFGVAVGDSCTFYLESGAGLWIMGYKNNTIFPTPGIAFNGGTSDVAELTTGGQIGYLSAGSQFTDAAGKMEINFPGFTTDKSTEVIYGQNGKNIICKPS